MLSNLFFAHTSSTAILSHYLKPEIHCLLPAPAVHRKRIQAELRFLEKARSGFYMRSFDNRMARTALRPSSSTVPLTRERG
jgi:hypothetical protein